MSAPSFLVDECLPSDVTLALRERGLEVTDLFERGLRGLSDAEVWALAGAENRVLVTRDLDFPLRVPGPRPTGLVLLRAPDDATAPDLAALVRALLSALPVERMLDHITVAAPGRYRQRRW